jgi:hypothetical protein
MEWHRWQLATPPDIPPFNLFMNRCCGADRLHPGQVHFYGEAVMWANALIARALDRAA